jgi:RNA polymerase sigma-70 factor (ECF subfamily)
MEGARGAAARIGDGIEVAVTELSFDELFEIEHRALFRALYLITGDVQDAEELMQDAFLKVWERWDRVSRMENPGGYLARVAINGARSRIRRLKVAAKRAIAPVEAEDPFAAADLHDELVRALARLSQRQRMALVLTDLMELSADEAATILNVKAPTVRSLASQARLALRTELEVDRG